MAAVAPSVAFSNDQQKILDALKGDECTEANRKGFVNPTFFLLYKVLCIIAIIIFVFVLCISFADIVSYLWRDANQRRRFMLDSNLMNKDTLDMDAMVYLTNDPKKEIYHIYRIEEMLNGILTILGIIIIIAGIQLSIFFIIKFLFKKSRLACEAISPSEWDIRLLASLMVVVAAAVALSSLYSSTFLKKVRPGFQDVRKKLNKVKAYIYANMTTDNQFLLYMTQNNLQGILKHMQGKLETDKNKARSSADDSVRKMLFTTALYTYFSSKVKENDVEYDNVMNIFSSENTRSRRIDPTKYFSYSRAIYVPNPYIGDIRDTLSPFLGVREMTFSHDLAARMRTLNRFLGDLQTLPIPKRQMFSFIVQYFLLAVLFAMILGAVVHPKGGELILTGLVKIKTFVVGLFSKDTAK